MGATSWKDVGHTILKVYPPYGALEYANRTLFRDPARKLRKEEDKARLALMGREKASREFRERQMSAQEKAAAAARAGGKARATTRSAGSLRRNTVPGQRGTILTSPQGVLDDADSGLGGIRGRRRKTLLGS